MATRFYLYRTATGDATPPGNLSSDVDLPLLLSRDTETAVEAGVNTVAGPTAGVQIGGTLRSWWVRVNAVTIASAITKNFWMAESNMAANVGAQVIVDRYDGSAVFVSTVQNSELGTELPVTTRAAQNWATGTVTSTTFSDGDYIRVRVYGNDVGTMASGHTFNLQTGATSAGVDGDSWIEFTETITEYVASTRVPRFKPYPQLLAH